MDWEPNERDAWVIDAQRWIGKINGVLQCKIDLDANGDVTGVHVVAGMDREPRHIVRDVESLLKARLGLDVYYKKIGVVQVLDSGPAIPDASLPAADNSPPKEIVTPPAGLPASVEEIEPIREFPGLRETEKLEEGISVESPPMESSAQAAVLLTEEIAPRLVCNGVGTMARTRPSAPK